MVRLQGCSQLSVEEKVLASHLSVSEQSHDIQVNTLPIGLYFVVHNHSSYVSLYFAHTHIQISQDTEISITLN